MKRFASILFLSGLLIFVALSPLLIKSDQPNKKLPEIKSRAFEGLEFWSNQRVYPNKSIPNATFYTAYEYSKNNLRKELQLFETQDDWKSIGPANRGGRTLALAVDPKNPDVIYAGSASGGLWRLTISGQSYDWEFIDTGFPVLGVNAIVIDPTDSDVIYIGTGEVYGYQQSIGGLYIRTTRGSYGIGLLKSSNRGKTWTKSLDWSYYQQRGVLALEINPVNPKTIFAGTTEGVYKSIDSGESWEKVLPVLMAVDVAINPGDTSFVFASCGNLRTTSNTGIYRSDESGRLNSWKKLTFGLPSSWGGKALLDIHQANPNIIFASIGNGYTSSAGTWLCKSEDKGDHWTIVTRHNYSSYQGWFAHYVRVDPINPNRLFCAGVNFYISSNSGSTLYEKSGMHVDHHCFANHPSNPNIVYFGNDGGVFRTLDGGDSFQALNNGYITSQFYNGFASSVSNPDLALGGLQDNGTVKYTGNDKKWVLEVLGGDGAFCGINSQNDKVMYASSQYLNLFRTTDGTSFSNIAYAFNGDAVFIAPYVLSPAKPWIMYAGDTFIYRTENSGTSWSKMNNGEPLNDNPILSIAVSSVNPEVVYAATVPSSNKRAEVFASVNGGFNWSNVTGSLPDRYYVDLQVSPHNENIAYITLSGFGSSHLYRTENGGLSWMDIDNGQLPDIPTSAVAIDPENSNHIYIGNDLGVYVSTDYGVNWSEFRDGLPPAVLVMDLSISPGNRKIRAVTHGNGAYERTLITPTSVRDHPGVVASFQLDQNYPNPFTAGGGSAFGGNPETEIQFQLPEKTHVSLKIFNTLGQNIITLLDKNYYTGTYSATWNGKDQFGRDVPSGIYFYQISTDNFSQIKKMTLLR